MLEHPMAEQWWCSKGQDWPYYLTVLQSNLTLDGLELWCTCAASRTHMTFIQHDQVWSTQDDGPHDNDYAVMWLVEGAVYCNIYLQDEGVSDFEAFQPEGQVAPQPK